uniref:Vac14_Fig4_bd domain-containing protein n=1 Tax=Mesocestoides corti TaxID=53468 RepID=A0A5K3G0E9_MESCO
MDQLIQLLESPVFASALLCSLSLSHFHHLELASVRAFLIAGLRLHLVDRRYSAALQETLYCLLMCLPQTEAFETLRRRLQCLPSHTLVEAEVPVTQPSRIDFDALLDHFHKVQRLHFENRVKETQVTDADGSADVAVEGAPSVTLELGFLHPTATANPLMATPTEFLIKVR